MTRILAALASLSLLALAPAASAAPRFDSSYTRLGQDCKELPQPDAPDGQDPVLDCPGPAGLHARLHFSAADANLLVVRPQDTQPDGTLDSLIEGVMGVDATTGVVEWRLADGQPFAIIVRSRPAVFDDSGAAKPGSAQTLEVRSIQPLPAFQHAVDVHAVKDANAHARELADAGWTAAKR